MQHCKLQSSCSCPAYVALSRSVHAGAYLRYEYRGENGRAQISKVRVVIPESIAPLILHAIILVLPTQLLIISDIRVVKTTSGLEQRK